LEHIVKIGLAEYLKKRSIEDVKDYTKQSFKYKYYRAFRPDGTEKSGVNRILFNFKGVEIKREYVPEGLPTKFEWATIAEIDNHGTIYPNIQRNELIKPN
jgi:hypothetical protein